MSSDDATVPPDLRDKLLTSVRERALDFVRDVELEIGEDSQHDTALFVTAVIGVDPEDLDDDAYVEVSDALHEVLRNSDLEVPHYVRIQDVDAQAEDPVTAR
jgi:hypothetical protein